MKTFETINEMYLFYCRYILEKGESISPRGLETRELRHEIFAIKDTSNYWPTLKNRKLNYRFAIMEALLNLSGKNSPEIIGFYNKNILNFMNPITKKFNGAYGPRIQPNINNIIDELKRDPDSRRAVIEIYNHTDLYPENNDVPCTLSLHFLVRHNKLDISVHMRSNDILWGTAYDVGQFSMLRDYIARRLNILPGVYIHIADSLHAYSSTFDKIERINGETNIFNIPKVDFSISDLVDFMNKEEDFRLYGTEEIKENMTFNSDFLDQAYKIITTQSIIK